MHQFTKKQIALAVAAGLGSMAAHAGVVGKVGATQPVLASKNGATLSSLYKVAGDGNNTGAKVNIVVSLNGAPAASAGLVSQGVFDSAVNWNQLQSNADSLNDFVISYGTAAKLINKAELALADSTGAAIAQGATMALGTAAGGVNFTFTLTPAADHYVRIDNATGKLQYADSSGTFGDINVIVKVGDSTGSSGTVGLLDSTGSGWSAGSAGTNILSKAVVTGSTLALSPEAKTRATNGLLDGVVIDFRHPLAATPAANDIVLIATAANDVAPGTGGTITGATGVTQTITAGGGFVKDSTNLDSTGMPYYSTSTAPNTALTIAVSGMDKADWTTGGASADAAVYVAKSFNTGIQGANVPYKIKAWDTSASLTGKNVTYANVYFESNGVAAKYDSNSTNPIATGDLTTLGYKDGADPIPVKAEFNATDSVKGSLVITFSETLKKSDSAGVGALPGAAITPDATERKILNTIHYTAGTVTTALGALGFNNDVTIGIKDSVNSNGVTDLTLTNVPKDVLNETAAYTLTVNKRISVLSPAGTDGAGAGYTTSFDRLDTNGALIGATTNNPTGSNFGSTTVAGAYQAFEAVSGSTSITKKITATTLAGAKCAGFTAADENYVGSIVCTFTGTVTKMASNGNFTDKFLITTVDSANTPFAGDSVGASRVNFFAADSAVSVSGSSVTITLPTAMKTATATAMSLSYLDTAGVLQDSSGTAIAAGQKSVDLPFSVTGSNQMFYTMDAKGKLVGASNGARMTAYLAKWFDAADATKLVTTVTNGRVTDPGDKTATDMLLTVDTAAYNHDGDAGTANKSLPGLMDDQLATTSPKPIAAYVHFKRTNDPARGNTGNSSTGANGDNLRWANATINTDPTVAAGETVYVVSVDPKTGNISGRLNGQIGVSLKPSAGTQGNRGLAFVQTDGKLAFPTTAQPTGASAAKAQALVKGDGSFRLFLGADAKAMSELNDAFILAVLEETVGGTTTRRLVTSADPAATNFVPFKPSLSQTKDATRATIPDITLANIVEAKLATSTSWQLVGAGNLDRKTGAVFTGFSLPRAFVQLDTSDVVPEAVWTNDQKTGDMALSMYANRTGVATEGSTGDTVSTFAPKGNAVAFGFMNDGGTNAKQNGTGLKSLFFLTKTSEDVALPAQTWSLISVPKSWETTIPTGVSMILKVGAGYGTGNLSWSKDAGDAAISLKANEPVFVFSKTLVTGK